MNNQIFFNYQFSEKNDQENFFVNKSNEDAYKTITDNYFDQNIFLYGPEKSGKSHLLNIWKKNNQALIFENNFNEIINSNKNIAIDDILIKHSQEELFHIINHSKAHNLKILVTSSFDLNYDKNILKDLLSRLKSFYNVKINSPNEEMCKIIMTKLFYEKQIIIKNKEIFNFIFNRVHRTYSDIYSIVQKIDKLSLEKKKQLTIPLIREIL